MDAPFLKFFTLSQFYMLILNRVLVSQSIPGGRYVSNPSMHQSDRLMEVSLSLGVLLH